MGDCGNTQKARTRLSVPAVLVLIVKLAVLVQLSQAAVTEGWSPLATTSSW